jgi:hypothetical protein
MTLSKKSATFWDHAPRRRGRSQRGRVSRWSLDPAELNVRSKGTSFVPEPGREAFDFDIRVIPAPFDGNLRFAGQQMYWSIRNSPRRAQEMFHRTSGANRLDTSCQNHRISADTNIDAPGPSTQPWPNRRCDPNLTPEGAAQLVFRTFTFFNSPPRAFSRCPSYLLKCLDEPSPAHCE